MRWLITVLFLLTPVLAQAHMLCFPPGEVQSRLKVLKGQSPIFMGDTPEHTMTQVWLNPNDLTWSVVVYRSDGRECILIHGINFRTYKGFTIETSDGIPL